jgi:acetyl esterase/lipase
VGLKCCLGLDKWDTTGVRVVGRAEELSNLPPTYIVVGISEVSRDAPVRFATRISQAEGIAELHVWQRVYPGAAMFEPHVAIEKEMLQFQQAFLHKVIVMDE